MRYFIYCRKSSEAEDRQIASIESQLTTLKRTFSDRTDIEVVGIFEESFSAKAPGRLQFGEMLAQIEKGTAHGVIAWAPDRLARNSIDGGRLIYMLDCGVIRDLKFATYSFENNSQGKFMLQIMFGQSKYYSDALSDNVKRGNRTKIEKGWRPNQAPLGYLNDPDTKTIVKDPIHFPLIRAMFELMLTGSYTAKQVAVIARDEWGFLTPRKKRIGGRPLALSSIYQILSNPFYAGIIVWGGQTYPGKHEPVTTIDEFERVRSLLDRPGRARPKRHTFAFTGMIRCGSCGLAVTAEHKYKPSGRHYIYYHCTKRRLGPRCVEPSVEVRTLEEQVGRFIRSLAIDPAIDAWVRDEMTRDAGTLLRQQEEQQRALENSLKSIEEQLAELTSLRIRNLLNDQEYLVQRGELQKEHIRLRERIASKDHGSERFEPVSDLISFSNRAADWFLAGDDRSKRLILETVGSNPTLTRKRLRIEAKKPFALVHKTPDLRALLGVDDDVRTLHGKGAEWAQEISRELQTEDGQRILHNIRLLRQRFEPEALAKDEASRSRRGKLVRVADRAKSSNVPSQIPPQQYPPKKKTPEEGVRVSRRL
ncbi:recombinase family protein [Bradyrhizobium elkanii]|uniref:recombinase family protein n=1 Tax=Bradyrhizobium elkanii TaxID=29448 RepID=UPI002226011C|nr:recombinase family protein [Bradyrhizobium elkanii]MCW2114434.1 DNA invertase Pin-like site-specific DNA recombinase [Bradyrhizobium elkanii]